MSRPIEGRATRPEPEDEMTSTRPPDEVPGAPALQRPTWVATSAPAQASHPAAAARPTWVASFDQAETRHPEEARRPCEIRRSDEAPRTPAASRPTWVASFDPAETREPPASSAGPDRGARGSVGVRSARRHGLHLVAGLASLMACTAGCSASPPVRQAGAGPVVSVWAPPGISSSQFESHAAFDPWTGDLYFVRSSPRFEGWRIVVSRCSGGSWGPAVDAPFAGAGVEADPFFTADGRSLLFISTRLRASARAADLDIWRVDRDAGGTWQAPVRLPEPVNSEGSEWFPRPSRDGWLYFGSSRPGGLGGVDIWRAREDHGAWTVENLGPAVNSAKQEFEPLPSPDGTRLIVMADGGLFETRRTGQGWSARAPLPPAVNANGSEVGALFSPSGRSLLFARDTRGPGSGEFFVWHMDGAESWPGPCGPAR